MTFGAITVCSEHVRAIELTNAIFGETSPRTNGLCARFVANETQGEIESHAIACVAVVGDTHGSDFLVVAARESIRYEYRKFAARIQYTASHHISCVRGGIADVEFNG